MISQTRLKSNKINYKMILQHDNDRTLVAKLHNTISLMAQGLAKKFFWS